MTSPLTVLAWSRAARRATAGDLRPANIASVPLPAPPMNAVVVSVHDGDTINVIANPYKRHYVGSAAEPQPIRLLGCNAAELRTPGGDAAAANLKALLPVGTPVVLSNIDDDKYAPRWDASVACVTGGQVVDLVAYLVQQQWAAAWNGSGKAPVPPFPRTVAS